MSSPEIGSMLRSAGKQVDIILVNYQPMSGCLGENLAGFGVSGLL